MLRRTGILSLMLLLLACNGNQYRKLKDDFRLKIEFLGCRGMCPDYSILIDETGQALWQGNSGVERLGNYQKQLPRPKLKQMARLLENADFFGFKGGYGTESTDLPGIQLTFRHHGRLHSVKDIDLAPKELKALEADLMAIIGEEGWQKL